MASRRFSYNCACANGVRGEEDEDGGNRRQNAFCDRCRSSQEKGRGKNGSSSSPPGDGGGGGTCSSSTRSSPVSPVSSFGNICRICHDGDSKEDLVSPCKCAGSMQLVHRTCLEKWLSASNTDACEICKYKFIIYKQPKSFSEWIRRPSRPDDYRNLMGDLLCFTILTPLATISSYLCFVGAKHYAFWSTRWEAGGLVCLSVLLITIYVTWCFVTTRYHYRVWKDWRVENQNVHLIQMRRVTTNEFRFVSSVTSEGGNVAAAASDYEEMISMIEPHSGIFINVPSGGRNHNRNNNNRVYNNNDNNDIYENQLPSVAFLSLAETDV